MTPKEINTEIIAKATLKKKSVTVWRPTAIAVVEPIPTSRIDIQWVITDDVKAYLR